MLLEKNLQTSQIEYVHILIWSLSFGDWTWSNVLLACMIAHVAPSCVARQNLSLHFPAFSCILWMPSKNPTFNKFSLFLDMPWSFVSGPKRQHISVRHWPILASVWPRCVWDPPKSPNFICLSLNPQSWCCEASHWLLSNALMVHQLLEPDSGNLNANALWQ